MPRNYAQELADVQAAIDNAQQNGGYTTMDYPDIKLGMSLQVLYRRARELKNLIRLRNGGGRNAGC